MKTGNDTIDRADGHYTIITADSHAGGSHAAYREYLEPAISRISTHGGRTTRTPSRTSVTTGACATGTTRCGTANRKPTAW